MIVYDGMIQAVLLRDGGVRAEQMVWQTMSWIAGKCLAVAVW